MCDFCKSHPHSQRDSIEVIQWNGWHIASRRGLQRDQFIAWSSRQPIQCESPVTEQEHGDVRFEFGRTREEALDRLKADLSSPAPLKSVRTVYA